MLPGISGQGGVTPDPTFLLLPWCLAEATPNPKWPQPTASNLGN
jgi:hypothetical protein